MLGLSLAKILFTGAVILLVWYGFKWMGRVQANRVAEAGRKLREAVRAQARSTRPREPEAEDTVVCPACGAYVPARGIGSCERPDCPYLR